MNFWWLRYTPTKHISKSKHTAEVCCLWVWRRSWTMNFWWLRYTPTKYIWDPRLTFTGITVLGYNAETGVSPPALRCR